MAAFSSSGIILDNMSEPTGGATSEENAVLNFFLKGAYKLLPAGPAKTIILKIFNSNMSNLTKFIMISLCGLGFLLQNMPVENISAVLSKPPSNPSEIDAATMEHQTAICVTGGWKAALIVSHLIIFLVVPFSMRVLNISLRQLGQSESSVFCAQLSLSLLMTAIIAQVGTHIMQCWYYTHEYGSLNFMFHFFVLISVGLLADALVIQPSKTTRRVNIAFAFVVLLSCISYSFGVVHQSFVFMATIQLGLVLMFVALIWRAHNMLDGDKRIFLVPFCSIVLNLVLTYALQMYGGDPLLHPNVPVNVILHVARDTVGITFGLGIFTYLFAEKAGKLMEEDDASQPILGSSA